jgi:hypothetical protein
LRNANQPNTGVIHAVIRRWVNAVGHRNVGWDAGGREPGNQSRLHDAQAAGHGRETVEQRRGAVHEDQARQGQGLAECMQAGSQTEGVEQLGSQVAADELQDLAR